MASTLQSLQPNLTDMIQAAQQLSTAERLLLAKTLLDSLVATEIQPVRALPTEPDDQSPTLAEVVAQIKATPPNPKQIQRATKTVDEVFAGWEESATAEPPLTTAEWEQNWWAIRQEMQQRDQQSAPRLDQPSDDHG